MLPWKLNRRAFLVMGQTLFWTALAAPEIAHGAMISPVESSPFAPPNPNLHVVLLHGLDPACARGAEWLRPTLEQFAGIDPTHFTERKVESEQDLVAVFAPNSNRGSSLWLSLGKSDNILVIVDTHGVVHGRGREKPGDIYWGKPTGNGYVTTPEDFARLIQEFRKNIKHRGSIAFLLTGCNGAETATRMRLAGTWEDAVWITAANVGETTWIGSGQFLASTLLQQANFDKLQDDWKNRRVLEWFDKHTTPDFSISWELALFCLVVAGIKKRSIDQTLTLEQVKHQMQDLEAERLRIQANVLKTPNAPKHHQTIQETSQFNHSRFVVTYPAVSMHVRKVPTTGIEPRVHAKWVDKIMGFLKEEQALRPWLLIANAGASAHIECSIEQQPDGQILVAWKGNTKYEVNESVQGGAGVPEVFEQEIRKGLRSVLDKADKGLRVPEVRDSVRPQQRAIRVTIAVDTSGSMVVNDPRQDVYGHRAPSVSVRERAVARLLSAYQGWPKTDVWVKFLFFSRSVKELPAARDTWFKIERTLDPEIMRQVRAVLAADRGETNIVDTLRRTRDIAAGVGFPHPLQERENYDKHFYLISDGADTTYADAGNQIARITTRIRNMGVAMRAMGVQSNADVWFAELENAPDHTGLVNFGKAQDYPEGWADEYANQRAKRKAVVRELRDAYRSSKSERFYNENILTLVHEQVGGAAKFALLTEKTNINSAVESLLPDSANRGLLVEKPIESKPMALDGTITDHIEFKAARAGRFTFSVDNGRRLTNVEFTWTINGAPAGSRIERQPSTNEHHEFTILLQADDRVVGIRKGKQGGAS
ncbi:MAG TPA: VWA domain-containing protein [Polyangium sp.]|nr:VWA domain-containing protein [Polyangium sp.]